MLGPEQPFDAILEQFRQYYCYTPPQNISGGPAISLPLQRSREGLPIGMQFVGRFGDEGTLLRLAAQLERAHPWIEQKPALIA